MKIVFKRNRSKTHKTKCILTKSTLKIAAFSLLISSSMFSFGKVNDIHLGVQEEFSDESIYRPIPVIDSQGGDIRNKVTLSLKKSKRGFIKVKTFYIELVLPNGQKERHKELKNFTVYDKLKIEELHELDDINLSANYPNGMYSAHYTIEYRHPRTQEMTRKMNVFKFVKGQAIDNGNGSNIDLSGDLRAVPIDGINVSNLGYGASPLTGSIRDYAKKGDVYFRSAIESSKYIYQDEAVNYGNYESYTNQEDFNTKVTVKAGEHVGIGPLSEDSSFSATLSANISLESTIVDAHAVHQLGYATFGKGRGTDDPDNEGASILNIQDLALTDDALDILTQQGAKAFFDTYGSHFISDIYYGTELRAMYQYYFDDEKTKVKLDEKIKESAGNFASANEQFKTTIDAHHQGVHTKIATLSKGVVSKVFDKDFDDLIA